MSSQRFDYVHRSVTCNICGHRYEKADQAKPVADHNFWRVAGVRLMTEFGIVLMILERWTVPSEMFQVSWSGEGLDRVVVLHTRVESDFATTSAVELIVGLADLVGVADDTTIAVATRN